MKFSFYNTLNHRIEEFSEIVAGRVGLYTCGPTVYDYPHIGNFRSYIFEDLLKRYLLYLGYQVRHVMNITDIDDKIIRKANESGVGIAEVSLRFTEAFFKDRDCLRILPADAYPTATGHIEEMVTLIETLLQKGLAYKKDGSVYFSIAKFHSYGRLANLDRSSLKTGVRVDLDEYDKEEVQDFALWKSKKEGEPSWSTRIGEGRPGWHIECSAMSMKYFGPTFDIHMGGVDNIFPHHENEIAQSEGATGQKFVNYWLHCQHLIVDNQKMSKSLGNYYTLDHLLQKGYEATAIRYLLLSTHYRKLLNFTLESLDAAKSALARIRNFVLSLRELQAVAGKTPGIESEIEKTENNFRACMNDDLNISGGLGVFFDFLHAINARTKELKQEDVSAILRFVERIDSVLGVLDLHPEREMLEAEIQAKIDARQAARKQKDFALADRIRDELKAKGILLMDTPQGVTWRKSN